MFNMKTFIMDMLKGMIGNELDYKVREYALAWLTKGLLTEDNLSEINNLIEAKNTEPTDEYLATPNMQ